MPSWVWVLVGGLALALLVRRFVGKADPVDVWRQLAEGLGLRYEQGGATGPSVRGRYRDVEIRVTGERDPSAGPGAPLNGVVQAEISLPGTVGVWGAASHRTEGSSDPWSKPGRDGVALVRQHNSRSVGQALKHPEVLAQVREFLARHPRARISDDWVTLVVPGPLRDPKRLHQILDEVTGVALAFQNPGAGEGAEDTWQDRADTGDDLHQESAPATGRDPAPGGGLSPNPYAPPAGPGATSSPWSPPVPMTLPAADPAIASRWKMRAGLAYLLGLLPSLLGACVAMIGGIRAGHLLWGVGAIWWVALGGALFGLGLLIFMTSYKCPKCGRFIRSPRSGRIVLDPEHCPSCQTRLRDATRPAGTPPD